MQLSEGIGELKEAFRFERVVHSKWRELSQQSCYSHSFQHGEISCKWRRSKGQKKRERMRMRREEKTQKESSQLGNLQILSAHISGWSIFKGAQLLKNVCHLGSELKKRNRIFILISTKITAHENKTNDTLKRKKKKKHKPEFIQLILISKIGPQLSDQENKYKT